MSKAEVTEAAEFEVLTDEQIAALPKEVKSNVVFLSENMQNKEIAVLNPLVSTLFNIKERADKLKVAKDEFGDFTEECIESYKAIKADQRSFNGDLTRAGKSMKGPYAKITKGIIAIEKTFKTISDKIKDDIELKFAEYETAKAAKEKAAQEKRDEALLSAVASANEEADKLKDQNAKAGIYNHIKLKLIAEGITEKASDAIFDANETTLGRIKAGIAQGTWDRLVDGTEVHLLDDAIIVELQAYYDKSKQRAILLIDGKLTEYENNREREVQAAVLEKTAAPANINWKGVDHDGDYIPPAPPVPSVPIDFKITDEDAFIMKIVNGIQSLETAVNIRINEGATPKLVALKNKFNAFNDAV